MRPSRTVHRCGLLALLASALVTVTQPALAQSAELLASIDRGFENFQREAHIPGMVYGIVLNGKLLHVKSFGVQDIETNRPVNSETLFRIASMTKAFTALSVLKLRDDGKVSLDAAAERYIPAMRGWRYPTKDSPKIRVRDLLTHTPGFVTDDPWGDRQTPLPEAEFTRLLREGVPFTRTPAMAMEYSNLGYAMLGRIIANTSGTSYATFVTRTILQPLGMASTGYHVERAPAERRALGYRWEDGAWRLEPTMAHGAFGAMGGLQTSANDYSKWLVWLLSAWPPRDGADPGPIKRSTVREVIQGANFPSLRTRPGTSGVCQQATTYAMGWSVTVDCELGLTINHGGGYPGYGSFVLLMPELGAGVFALTNRTYAGPRPPVWDAAAALWKAGVLRASPTVTSSALNRAYAAVGNVYSLGSLTPASELLAMNFLMDRSAEGWAADLASLKSQVGSCETSAPITATGAHSGQFTWRCERGALRGSLLLAPTNPPKIQALGLSRVSP